MFLGERCKGIALPRGVFSLSNTSKCMSGLPNADNSCSSGVEFGSHCRLEALCRRGLGKRDEEKLIQLKL